MMHEYEDDFFFEEDKIVDQRSGMWPQYGPFYYPLGEIRPLVCAHDEDRIKHSEPRTQKNITVDAISNLLVSVDLLSPAPNQLEPPIEDASASENKNGEMMDNELALETECVFNDLRQERYMLQYQELLSNSMLEEHSNIARILARRH